MQRTEDVHNNGVEYITVSSGQSVFLFFFFFFLLFLFFSFTASARGRVENSAAGRFRNFDLLLELRVN